MNLSPCYKALTFAALAALTISLAFFIIDSAAAETHEVDEGESIQDAIDGAGSGDTILINPGTYTEQITISKQLRLFGNDADPSRIVIDGDDTGNTVTFSVGGIVFQNFSLEDSGGGNSLIVANGRSNSNISNCVFEVKWTGITFDGGANNHEVYDCAFFGASSREGAGILVINADELTIINSTFRDLNYGIQLDPAQSPMSITNTDNTVNDCILAGNNKGFWFNEMGAPELKENSGTDLSENSIYGNEDHGILYQKDNVEPPIGAEKLIVQFCWWGDESGPFVPGGNAGEGDVLEVQVGEIMMDCYQPWTSSPRRAPTTFYVDDDGSANWYDEDGNFETIQEALDESFKNDVVRVYAGTYNENTYMNRSQVSLIGNGSDDVTIDADGEGNALAISGNQCYVEGITFIGATESDTAGILVTSEEISIFEVAVTGNDRGFQFKDAKDCSIENSTAENNGVGAEFQNVDGSNIMNCSFKSSTVLDITLQDCSNIFIFDTLAHLGGGLEIDGGGDHRVSHSTFSNSDSQGISILGSSDNLLENCTLVDNTGDGLIIRGDSKDNLLENCTIHNNGDDGIAIFADVTGEDNGIRYSAILGNSGHGVYSEDSGHSFDASYVYWGAKSGPYHATTNTEGTGDEVSDYVTYTPFLRKNVTEFQVLYRPKTTTRENRDYEIKLTVWNPDDEAVNYNTKDLPSFLSFEESNTTIYGRPGPGDVGNHKINITAEPAVSKDDVIDFSLEVLMQNDPPVIKTADDEDVDQDEAYFVTYEADDSDTDQGDLTWGWYNNDSADFLDFDTGTLELSGTPGNDDVGSYVVCIYVSDEENTTYSEFTLTVHNVNDDPVIDTTQGEVTKDATEDDIYTFTFTGHDIDETHGDSVSWDAEMNPARAGVLNMNSGTGELQLAFTDDDEVGSGSFEITVTLEDTDEGATDEFTYTLTVTAVNDRPKIDTSPETNVNEETYYEQVFQGSDEETDTGDLTWGWDNNDSAAFLNFNSDNQTLYGKPSQDEVGNYEICIELTDGDGKTVYKEFTLRARAVDDPPEIDPFMEGDMMALHKGEFYSLSITAFDPDDDPEDLDWDWTVTPDADFMHFEKDGNHTFWFTATAENFGDYYVEISVEDSETTVVSEFAFRIYNKNDPPKIVTPLPGEENDTFYSGIYYEQPFTAEDPDLVVDDSLTWYLDTNAGTWLMIGEENGTLYGKPPVDETGTYYVNITVEDSHSLSDFQNFTFAAYVPIDEKPVAKITSITPLEPILGETVSFNAGGSSDDGSIAVYSWSSDLDDELYNGSEASFNTSTLSRGNHEITLVVQDNAGQWSSLVTQDVKVKKKGSFSSAFNLLENPSLIYEGFLGQNNPTISGNLVVWQQALESDSWEIFLFDSENPTEVKQISDAQSSSMKGKPLVQGNRIVWIEKNTEGDYQFMFYDLKYPVDGGEKLLDLSLSPDSISSMDLWGDWLVWTGPMQTDESVNIYYDLFIYRISSNSLKEPMKVGSRVALYDGKIAYFDVSDSSQVEGKTAIVIYDLVGKTNVSRHTVSLFSYDIYEVDFWDTYVAFDHDPGLEGTSSNIYLIDLEAGTIGRVTGDEADYENPSVSGTYLVWEGAGVHAYDIVKNMDTTIHDTGSNKGPVVSADIFVWTHTEPARASGELLYYYNLTLRDSWMATGVTFTSLDAGDDGNGTDDDGDDLPVDLPGLEFLLAGGLAICGALCFVYLLLAIWHYKDAEKRGKSGVGWLLVSLILPILATIIWLIVRPKLGGSSPDYGGMSDKKRAKMEKKAEKERLKAEKKAKKKGGAGTNSEIMPAGLSEPASPAAPPAGAPPVATPPPQYGQQPYQQQGVPPAPGMPPYAPGMSQQQYPQMPPQQQYPQMQQPMAPQVPVAGGAWQCTSCGKQVEGNFAFCIFCGASKT